MSASPTSSRPSWPSSPSQSSHHRGVQTRIWGSRRHQEEASPQILETARYLFEGPKPQILDPAAYMFPRPPPVAAATTEIQKHPLYDYKPTPLRWWFMAAVVAVLVALTAVTEHSLRSLPDYGLDYDLHRLARSISQRTYPRTMPRVRNVTAETNSPFQPDPKTAMAIPQSVIETSSAAPVEPSTTMSTALVSVPTAPTGTTTHGTGAPTNEPQMEAPAPKTSSNSVTSSTVTSFALNSDERATQEDTVASYTSQTPATESQAATSSQNSGTSPSTTSPSTTSSSATSNGGYRTLDKALPTAKVAQTSTSICFDCSVEFSTPTSASLSLVTATSTIGIPTTIDGKDTTVENVVSSTVATRVYAETAGSEVPLTTIIQQVTTIPDTTVIAQHVTTDSLGSTSSQAVTFVASGTTSTMASAVVLHPGQSWVTTTGPVTTSILSSKTDLHTTMVANGNGETVTSTYLTTLSPSTVVVTATYGTIIGVGSHPAAATASSASSSDATANSMVIVVGISRSQYLSGSFLPTLIAVLVAMPLKAIGLNARLFQPFIALAASPAGTTAEASVLLRFHGWRNAIGAFPRAFRLRQPVVIVGQLLVAGSALLAPLAAEAVRVYVPDDCTGKCPGSLGVDIAAGRVLEVLMSLLLASLVGMVILLAWYKTGVKQHPWSIAGMAALGTTKEMRELLKGVNRGLDRHVDDAELSLVLEEHRYTLGGDGEESPYGIRVPNFPVSSGGDLLRRRKSDGKKAAGKPDASATAPAVPLFLLTLHGRIFVLLCFTAVLVLLLYYENSGNSDFEKFMNDQGFGVRFLFTALGVALGFSMSAFFRSVAVVSPHLQMSKRALPAQTCILVSPPSNPFSGLHSAFRQRHLYLGVLAVTSLMADFLPVTLSHVPFSALETSEAQHTCAYLSIAILVVMILVVAGSLAIQWPHMPVDPRTIAGALYYLCDSSILDSFRGLAPVEPRDRNWMVKSMCVQYRFGNIVGLSGKERVGVDAADSELTRDDMTSWMT